MCNICTAIVLGPLSAKYLVPHLHVQTLFLYQPLHQLHTSTTHRVVKQSEARLYIVLYIQKMHIQMREGTE